jgi:branched-chain amino acid aminotransferase
MSFVYLNDRLVSESEALVSVADRGFLLGDGLFETMRAYNGRVFRLQEHLARLRASAEFLRLTVPATDSRIEGRIAELIHRNGSLEAYVRITLTRGQGGRGLRMGGDFAPTLLIAVSKLVPYPAEQYRHGAKLIVSRYRQNSASPLVRHKTLSYLLYVLARQEAMDAGMNGALLLNEHGELTEESVSNVFLVKGGSVITPPVHCGLLPGITRGVVMELCGQAGIEIEERPISGGEIFECDEMFLTNSLMEIMPVQSVDKRPPTVKAPGPVTAKLQELYRWQVFEATNPAVSHEGQSPNPPAA